MQRNMDKKCSDCGQLKPTTEFYAHPKTADGLLGKCKVCHRASMKANRLAKVERYREYDRDRAMLDHRVAARQRYANTDAGRAAMRRARLASDARHPERRRARVALGNAVRDGRVIKPVACWHCGSTGDLHGHHPDYSRPLEVCWMCTDCHDQLHDEAEHLAVVATRETRGQPHA